MAEVALRRNRDFVLLQAGQLLSTTGTQSATVAYPLLVLAVTGSPALAGLVTFARVLPGVLFGLLGGVAAGRFNRKLLMIVADAGRAGAVGVLVLAIATGRLAFWQIPVVAFVEGTCTAVQPGRGGRAALGRAGQPAAGGSRHPAGQDGHGQAGRAAAGRSAVRARPRPAVPGRRRFVPVLDALHGADPDTVARGPRARPGRPAHPARRRLAIPVAAPVPAHHHVPVRPDQLRRARGVPGHRGGRGTAGPLRRRDRRAAGRVQRLPAGRVARLRAGSPHAVHPGGHAARTVGMAGAAAVPGLAERLRPGGLGAAGGADHPDHRLGRGQPPPGDHPGPAGRPGGERPEQHRPRAQPVRCAHRRPAAQRPAGPPGHARAAAVALLLAGWGTLSPAIRHPPSLAEPSAARPRRVG